MNKMLSKLRSACDEYKMIKSDDKIAVGLSGGKDSMVLLTLLSKLKEFYPVKFNLKAIFVDPCFSGKKSDISSMNKLCEQLGIELIYVKSDIYDIVFKIRKEKNPCSLCANLRRGILCNTAVNNNCNKIALGHHFDDAVETFFMNILNGGKISCFSPVTYLSKKNVTVIRPMIYCTKNSISECSKSLGLSILKSECPMDKTSNRTKTAKFIETIQADFPDIKSKVIGALKRANISGW